MIVYSNVVQGDRDTVPAHALPQTITAKYNTYTTLVVRCYCLEHSQSVGMVVSASASTHLNAAGGLHGWAGRTLASEDLTKPLAGSSQDVLRSLEPRVTDFTLPNGLRVCGATPPRITTHIPTLRCWCWNDAMRLWFRA